MSVNKAEKVSYVIAQIQTGIKIGTKDKANNVGPSTIANLKMHDITGIMRYLFISLAENQSKKPKIIIITPLDIEKNGEFGMLRDLKTKSMKKNKNPNAISNQPLNIMNFLRKFSIFMIYPF